MQFGIPGRDDSESMFPPIESFDRRIIDSLSALNIQLTPGEIQVAALIREGLTTKEIAGTLNISAHAVDFHRKNIRSKLGLNRKKSNLRSYLISLG